MRSSVIVSLALLALASASISNFVRYGPSAGDTTAPLCDDCYMGPIAFPFTFYGIQRSNVYINNNGLLSFDQANSQYTPYGIPSVRFPAVVGYWYDVDTRPNGAGHMYYRVSTNAQDLAFASARVGNGFVGNKMFVATWEAVGVFYYITSQLQTFQIVIITDANNNAYALLSYGQLQYQGAGIGVAKGDGVTYVSAPESITSHSASAPDRVIQINEVVVVIAPPSSVCGNGRVESGESCDGGACCTASCTFATTVCRASAGPCDAAETCSGNSASCPADSFQSASTVCRSSAGPCDVAETCSGNSAACPADSFASSSQICRAAADSCDLPESCTGNSVSCPADLLSQTTSCFCARLDLEVGQMGYYCNADGGFYQCLGGVFASQSRSQPCAQGTQCGCAFGEECSCGNVKSPCIYPTDVQTC